MDKPTPSTFVRHNDELSKALLESYVRWMDGETFQRSSIVEEGIPSLEKKTDLDNGTKKDPKAQAAPPDPATDLRTGSGVKQSHGAEIRDTTKVVSREQVEVLESHEIVVDGEIIIIEKVKMDGKDDNGFKSCWKGYKKQGTKVKGGKEVNNCVKAGYEPQGTELKEYFEKEKCDHCKGKGYMMVKKHNCAKKVKKEGKEYVTIPESHTMLADGTVTHYDLLDEQGNLLRNVPVSELTILVSETHEHYDNYAKNAEVLGEKKLDPVGKEDKDIDNDGDHDKSDKYLLARRKKVGKILAAKGKSEKK